MKILICLIFLALWIPPFTLEAQDKEGTVPFTISDEAGNSFKIDTAEFESSKKVLVKVKGHDGRVHEYSGLSLYDLLARTNSIPVGGLRGTAMTKYVLISAADTYKVVIALPEIEPSFTDQIITLANKVDNKSLSGNLGPYQLIVPGDKRQARWVRQVISIQVKNAGVN